MNLSLCFQILSSRLRFSQTMANVRLPNSNCLNFRWSPSQSMESLSLSFGFRTSPLFYCCQSMEKVSLPPFNQSVASVSPPHSVRASLLAYSRPSDIWFCLVSTITAAVRLRPRTSFCIVCRYIGAYLKHFGFWYILDPHTFG